jgi:hypothetical protein
VEIDVPFWSQHISFLFVGIIIAASIRGFLNQLMKVPCLGAMLLVVGCPIGMTTASAH